VQTIASSCTEECYNDPNCGLILAAGTDVGTGEIHAYGNACLSKLLASSTDVHNIRIHGLHELTDEQLAEVFTSGPYAHNEPDWWRDGVSGWHSNTGMILKTLSPEDESEYIAAVTTSADVPEGELFVISVDLLLHLFANPEESHGQQYVFHGTHVLPRRWLEDLFPADEVVSAAEDCVAGV
jgi:hypothetical protein